jgi:hypothetical protein
MLVGLKRLNSTGTIPPRLILIFSFFDVKF